MNVVHLLKVRFDRRTAAITQEWLDKRYEFFLTHTYKSLQCQTNKDWTLWIQCGDGIKPEHIRRLRDALPDAWFSFGDHALPVTHPLNTTTDWVYVTRLDSDDLYAPDALEIVRNCKPQSKSTEASIFKRGYLHEIVSGKTGVYHNPSSPFHTLMIPRDVWSSPEAYGDLWKRVGDHSRVAGSLPSQALPDFKFTVLIHGNNFISTYNYGRERGYVEKNWSIPMFLNRPVVFDVDDFCDELGGLETLNHLDRLKTIYPNFRCTLFTIPAKCSRSLLDEAGRRVNEGWLELALHGWNHYPTEELKVLTTRGLESLYRSAEIVNNPLYVRGFRPPGWYITKEYIEVLNSLGMWVALHKRDKELCKYIEHGYYMCEERFPYWHGHTHNTCGNWLRESMPTLESRWDRYQTFAKVSESLCVKSY